MAFEIINTNEYPGLCASAIQDRQVTQIVAGERALGPCTAGTQEPHGITIASAAVGEAVTSFGQGNYCKAIAAASLGGGADVGVDGATRSLGLVASGAWRVGKAVTPAAAGEVFTFYVNPRQLTA